MFGVDPIFSVPNVQFILVVGAGKRSSYISLLFSALGLTTKIIIGTTLSGIFLSFLHNMHTQTNTYQLVCVFVCEMISARLIDGIVL